MHFIAIILMSIFYALSNVIPCPDCEESIMGGRITYHPFTISIPITDFDSKQGQYHTINDYLQLMGKPSKDGLVGTSGQLIVQDHGLTPGAVRTTDPGVVCSQRTGLIRDVPSEEKKAIYEAYSQYYPQIADISSHYEYDHLVSLELGGSNSPTNIWPEFYNDPYGARIKDRLENFLHRQVCAGKIPLSQAQYMIAMDWRNAYIQYFSKIK